MGGGGRWVGDLGLLASRSSLNKSLCCGDLWGGEDCIGGGEVLDENMTCCSFNVLDQSESFCCLGFGRPTNRGV